MFGLGAQELLLILLIALFFFGGEKLPDIAKGLDVHFISSLPVKQRPACTAWADKRPVQSVWAVR